MYQNVKQKTTERESNLERAREIYSMYSPDFKKWVTEGIDRDFINFAEQFGKKMAENGLKSAQFRNVFGEIRRIQTGDFEKLQTSFFLLKPKMAYAAGRNDTIGLYLLKLAFDDSFSSINDKNSFQNFCDIMEAILAYHKSFSTNDK